MGCCCLDHRPSILYYTAARVDPVAGGDIIFYDALHPVVGDQSYFSAGQCSTIYVIADRLYNAVKFDSSVSDPRGQQDWIVVTCWDINSNSVLWWTHVDSEATLFRIYADANYIWLGTEDGEGFCLSPADGDLISETTGLDTVGYLYMTEGVTAGTVQWGPVAEYDHEFTATQTTGTIYDLLQAWDVGNHYITWHDNGLRVYKIDKDDLANETTLTTPLSPANAIAGATDTLYFANNLGTNYFKAYDYAGTVLWDNSTSDMKAYFNYDDGVLYGLNTSAKIISVDPADGSTNWTSTLGLNFTTQNYPRKSVIDSTNSQIVVSPANAVRPHNTSTGSVNWAVTYADEQEYQIYGGDLYISGARTAVPT